MQESPYSLRWGVTHPDENDPLHIQLTQLPGQNADHPVVPAEWSDHRPTGL